MSKQKGKKVKLPLKLRLAAWWEGYDPEELRSRLAARMPEEPTAPAKEKPKKEAAPIPQDRSELDPWDADTINIAQYIWGEGFCGPGGPEYIVALSKLLALSPEMSMLEIGAGLGGRARVLADKFGVWMTGFEENDMMVAKGRELSKMAGMEKKAEIVKYDPSVHEGFLRNFDRALAKESLYTIQDKSKIIGQVEEKLKPGGLFLITDYVLSSEAVVGKESYGEWKVGERYNPYPILTSDYEEILKSKRLQVRVSEDISDQYITMINQAWAGADKVAAKLAKEEDGARLIQVLMKEAEYWTRRKKMLESGDLRLWRFVANKKDSGPGMMSDW
ncbi:hypothetical protein GCM10017044_03930 [Kordiimonas sediminis]|uniref:Methyltransferase domain-containing protein n=1 Tax=Kordiimonas sediminis TaxID=1735581 RepID=A0A919AJV2_9PROT|nr:methyltransferase domain-containing protein [Kordiimonas sediminis]GHF13165.1 hypothetical protein GCM10017044_03930 [Kordiimonas sediminis]